MSIVRKKCYQQLERNGVHEAVHKSKTTATESLIEIAHGLSRFVRAVIKRKRIYPLMMSELQW